MMVKNPPIATASGFARQPVILQRLREEIVTGTFPPGARLPTRTDLEKRFNASRVTIQRVFDTLMEEGFVESRDRHGTFVAECPPHLSRLALVFPRSPDSVEGWPQFWSALKNEAERAGTRLRRPISVYYGIHHHSDLEDYTQLIASVENHRLAGLIFAAAPHHLKGSPVLDSPGVPRVAIMSRPDIPGVHAIKLDNQSFIERAVGYLASRGRKRLAVLMLRHSWSVHDVADGFAALVHRHGMETRPHWLQMSEPDCVANLMQLMMRLPESDRPDALVIANDNLVTAATEGLLAAGEEAVRGMDIVAHANFPWIAPSRLPARRLGFDCSDIIRQCIEDIDARRRQQTAPEQRIVSAVFEDELPRP